jgi:hypothetical protein
MPSFTQRDNRPAPPQFTQAAGFQGNKSNIQMQAQRRQVENDKLNKLINDYKKENERCSVKI